MGLPVWQKNKIVVKKFDNPQTGKTEMALLSFDGKMRDKIIANLNAQFSIDGNHIKNGGISSPKTMLSLIGGSAGSVGLSGLASGQLFMATANPATLMQIGNGVGSAVMGSGGIVAQAPFLPIQGALMPVAAPLIAFQALSTISIMKQFEVVNKRLDKIQDTINTIHQRQEATYVGEVISAFNRIKELEDQFSVCNQFSEDMIIRLSLLEDKINPLFERYNYLYKMKKDPKETVLSDVNLKQSDAFMAIVTSILDIRIDLLKMKLNLQNNPGYMETAAKAFVDKINFYHDLWDEIKDYSSKIDAIADELKKAVNEMNWWQRNMPSWLFGNREQRIEFEERSNDFEKESLKHQLQFNKQVDDANEFSEVVKESLMPDNKMSLIYWRDELGDHSYYTDDLLIESAAGK